METLTIRRITISTCLALITSAAFAAPFDQNLSLHGITFRVHASQASPVNKVTIQPKGLSRDNRVVRRDADGQVTEAEVADLNADGTPEIFVYVTSAGSGSYGSLIAYASNKGKSLSEITLPDIFNDKEASQGYMGHDEFSVVENRLGRRFPVYRPGDINSQPTGWFANCLLQAHAR